MRNKIAQWGILTCSLLLLMINVCKPQSESVEKTSDHYVQSITNWHNDRIAHLKQPYGWLSLVMREWLSDGSNEFPTLGTIIVEKGKVVGQLLPSLHAMRNKKPFNNGVLYVDSDTLPPQRVYFGAKAFVIIKRGDRYAVRMWDTTAETRTHFTDIERYPTDKNWCIEAIWQQYTKPKKIKISTIVTGFIDEGEVPGVAIFTVDGKECKLEPIIEEGSDEYFFIFADKTSGHETYGAGRFLYSKLPHDGKITLDFNKAYNPPCAFTPYATCPLPPQGNRLPVKVEAGEKKYGNH